MTDSDAPAGLDATRLAAELARRLAGVVPAAVTVRAVGGELRADIDPVCGTATLLGSLLGESDDPLADLTTAILAALAAVQDAVLEATTDPWPPGLPLPHVDDSEPDRIRLGYGDAWQWALRLDDLDLRTLVAEP